MEPTLRHVNTHWLADPEYSDGLGGREWAEKRVCRPPIHICPTGQQHPHSPSIEVPLQQVPQGDGLSLGVRQRLRKKPILSPELSHPE